MKAAAHPAAMVLDAGNAVSEAIMGFTQPKPMVASSQLLEEIPKETMQSTHPTSKRSACEYSVTAKSAKASPSARGISLLLLVLMVSF